MVSRKIILAYIEKYGVEGDFIDNSKIFHDRDFRVYNKESDYVTIIKIPENFEQQRDRGKLISSLRNMK